MLRVTERRSAIHGRPAAGAARRPGRARSGPKRPKTAPNDPERPKTDRTGPDAPPARYAARAARRTAEAEPGRARESLSRPIRRTPHDLPARRAARARVVT
ncbi:hypothetical protein DIJ61_13855 [Burkholderia pseudomallei]|uniref:Uncharacterized protein n=2 Tax=Burkholderia pseudomallei TaxID=28450 RepID=A0AAX0UGC9_BURPE|nr:hypothetical protein BURPS1710A_0794 [Burkholderia pseudomallei 1710a]PJO67294.1 hypothetical protein CWD88_04915 [Burkholderia pseudomallei]PPF06650.1 hypothetical protein B9D88_014385 [Burkholderia pseudomallei]TOY80069.1 hypothetical protein DIJ62_19740 [Burkholderia pseudomallei]TOZ66812.1 hypothetical protein DIJ60_03520 [Burkholderia pseudomallei]